MKSQVVIQKKVCMLGGFSVGKTSLIRRYVEGIFDEKYLSTIGVWISRKLVQNNDRNVNLVIWDLAGGDDYLKSNTNYLRGAAGAIIVCDLTRRDTLLYLINYAQQMMNVNPKATLVFVGNKADLVDERAISDEELSHVAGEYDSAFFMTSAKTGQNIEEVFSKITEKMLNS